MIALGFAARVAPLQASEALGRLWRAEVHRFLRLVVRASNNLSSEQHTPPDE